mgnify:CR=1 FL=1
MRSYLGQGYYGFICGACFMLEVIGMHLIGRKKTYAVPNGDKGKVQQFAPVAREQVVVLH